MKTLILMSTLTLLFHCAKGATRGGGDGGKIMGNPVELPDMLTMDTAQAQTFGALQYTLKGDKLDGVFGLTLLNTSNNNATILDQDLSQSHSATSLTTLANGFDVMITIYPSSPALENAFLYGQENNLKFVARAPGEDRFTSKGVVFEDFNVFSFGTSSTNTGDQQTISHLDTVQTGVVKNQAGYTLSTGLIHELSQ